MFDENSSTTKAPLGEAVKMLTNDTLMEQLRAIARKHQVCFEVWPERSVADGRKIQIGFELQLCGTNEHLATKGAQQPVPGCDHCLCTYEDLKQIAEWILPREERPSRYEIGGFDRSLHVGPHSRQSRNEVVVSIHIMHRSDFNREVDDCESRCLKEMRQRLSQLGIRQDMWRGDNRVEKGGSDETAG